MADQDSAPTEKKGKKAAANTVKVRVAGKQPLLENGVVYHPRREEPNGKGGLKTLEADTFEVDPERAEALGDAVEIVK